MAFLICFKEWGNKLSLKDRLKSTQKAPSVKAKQEQPLKYYTSNEEAPHHESLGVIDNLLVDEKINSIFVSGAKNVYIEKKGKTNKSTTSFRDNVQLENIIRKTANSRGIDLNETSCFSFNHKLGINVLATLPPLSNVATMFIKCYSDKHATLQVLQEENSVSKEVALVLEALCAIKKNILIVGEKSTLKTTLLSALSKKVPTNNRIVVLDKQCEIRIDGANYTNYDFEKINNQKIEEELLDAIINSNPDRIFINDNSDDLLLETIKKINKNFKGIVATFCAGEKENPIELFINKVMCYCQNMTYEKAKAFVLNIFDVIIFVKKDDLGKRKISSISQINLMAQDGFIQDVFNIDYLNQHKSTGIIPAFYDDIKMCSLPISDNIFDENYKHTYSKPLEGDAVGQFGRKGNIDILKKFKKDLPTLNDENIIENENKTDAQEDVQNVENFQESNMNDAEELMKKAQEKFDEIKNSVQINNEYDAVVEAFSKEENINEQL